MTALSLHSSASLSSYSKTKRIINATLHTQKQHTPSPSHISYSKLQTTGNLVQELIIKDESFTTNSNIPFKKVSVSDIETLKLYAILESVADRIEMHANVSQQREEWNSLLLNSINMITLTATTMVGIGSYENGLGSSPNLALNLGATLLFTAATGMLVVMNKIQPSQLVEEQRNATRLFKNLQNEIQTFLALNHVSSQENVEEMMEKVLALDRAYPLPLLGAMLEKFPKKFETAVWWPRKIKSQSQNRNQNRYEKNGWNKEIEREMREVIEVIKEKDREDYERLGNIGLKLNKVLAISGPVLTGIAAVGSMFLGSNEMAGIVGVSAGGLAAIVNTLEHGGQVGMVVEMYRNCGGFFKLMEESIERELEENDLEKRENGELFEMKVALQLGRSLSELKEITEKSASFRRDGKPIDEFASKLF